MISIIPDMDIYLKEYFEGVIYLLIFNVLY